MNLSAPFIRRPKATWLLATALLLAGAAALTQLPVAPLPRIDLPRIDLPTINVSSRAARREPDDDGDLGRDAARSPVRPDHSRPASVPAARVL